MSETNGGTLTVGQRLERIEKAINILQTEVRQTSQTLNDRVTRHKEANQEQVRKMAQTIVDSYDARIANLERHDVAEDAVGRYRRWLVATAIAAFLLLVAILGLLVNVVGKVN